MRSPSHGNVGRSTRLAAARPKTTLAVRARPQIGRRRNPPVLGIPKLVPSRYTTPASQCGSAAHRGDARSRRPQARPQGRLTVAETLLLTHDLCKLRAGVIAVLAGKVSGGFPFAVPRHLFGDELNK